MSTGVSTGAPRELSISWSKLRVHEECRQKAHLISAGKRGPATNLRNYFHGMVVDRCMRDWLADPTRRHGDMAAAVTAIIEDCLREARASGDGVVRWRNALDRAELTRFCVELVGRLEPILAERVLPYPFTVAQRFKVPVRIPYLDGQPTVIWLTGETDLQVQAPDGREVWDLKGTADDQYWRKTLGQLTFYDLAIYAQHGAPPVRTGLIQPMCTQPVLVATFTAAARAELWARITAMARHIWSGDVACKETTGGCTWCEVRHACVRYAPGAGNTLALTGPTTGPTTTSLAPGAAT